MLIDADWETAVLGFSQHRLGTSEENLTNIRIARTPSEIRTLGITRKCIATPIYLVKILIQRFILFILKNRLETS
jgi:hypothetical protein